MVLETCMKMYVSQSDFPDFFYAQNQENGQKMGHNRVFLIIETFGQPIKLTDFLHACTNLWKSKGD